MGYQILENYQTLEILFRGVLGNKKIRGLGVYILKNSVVKKVMALYTYYIIRIPLYDYIINMII